MSPLIVPLRPLRAVGLFGSLLACLAVLVFSAPSGFAQPSGKYTQLPVDQKLSRELKLPASRMLSEGFKSGDEQKFIDYYTKCVIPEWTYEANYAKTPSPLSRMVSDLKRAKRGPVYDALNRLLVDEMTKMAKDGNYAPAVRCNAMLMLGKLNTAEPASVTVPPNPLPSALPILLSAAADKGLPDAVRYEALLGVIRHSRYGAGDEPSRQKIGSLLLSVATMRDAPAGRSKAGHAWFRRVAIDALVPDPDAVPKEPGFPSQEAAIAKALADVLSEADASISLRWEAARALGALRLTPQMGLDPAAVGRSLESLLIDVAKEEIRLDSEDRSYKVDPRKLKARLIPIRAALSGYEDRIRASASFKALLGLAAKSDAEAPLLALREKIEKLLSEDLLDNPDLVPKERPRPGEAGPSGAGGAALGGVEGGPAIGIGGPGAPGAGGSPDQLDPAKEISDKIIAELKKIVEEYEKRQAGT